MSLNTKSLDFSIKAVDSEKGTFTAYGNTFNTVDHAGDMTMKGAFHNTIKAWNAKGRMPKLLSQHGHRQNPIGVITSMKEDEHGLLFEGKFCLEPGTAGAEAYALVKMGAIDQFSIGYKTVQEKMVGGVNELHEIDLKEISLVTFACNEDSLIQSVKSAIENDEEVTSRMVQKALQEAGLSKRQSEAAINAIKDTQAVEQLEKSVEASKERSENDNPSTEHLMEVKGDMSLSEYAKNICTKAKAQVEGENVYAWTKEIYMDKVILCVDDYSGDQLKEYFVKVPYDVKGHDVMVGSPVEVYKDVQWLTEEEKQARVNAGVKSDDILTQLKDALASETEQGDVAITATDLANWFK